MVYEIKIFGYYVCFFKSVDNEESDIENYKFGIKKYIETMRFELDKVNEENRDLWGIIINKGINVSSGLYGM